MVNNYIEGISYLKEVAAYGETLSVLLNEVKDVDFDDAKLVPVYDDVMCIAYKVSAICDFQFNMYLNKIRDTIRKFSKELLIEVMTCISTIVARAENNLELEIVKSYLNAGEVTSVNAGVNRFAA